MGARQEVQDVPGWNDWSEQDASPFKAPRSHRVQRRGTSEQSSVSYECHTSDSSLSPDLVARHAVEEPLVPRLSARSNAPKLNLPARPAVGPVERDEPKKSRLPRFQPSQPGSERSCPTLAGTPKHSPSERRLSRDVVTRCSSMPPNALIDADLRPPQLSRLGSSFGGGPVQPPHNRHRRTSTSSNPTPRFQATGRDMSRPSSTVRQKPAAAERRASAAKTLRKPGRMSQAQPRRDTAQSSLATHTPASSSQRRTPGEAASPDALIGQASMSSPDKTPTDGALAAGDKSLSNPQDELSLEAELDGELDEELRSMSFLSTGVGRVPSHLRHSKPTPTSLPHEFSLSPSPMTSASPMPAAHPAVAPPQGSAALHAAPLPPAAGSTVSPAAHLSAAASPPSAARNLDFEGPSASPHWAAALQTSPSPGATSSRPAALSLSDGAERHSAHSRRSRADPVHRHGRRNRASAQPAYLGGVSLLSMAERSSDSEDFASLGADDAWSVSAKSLSSDGRSPWGSAALRTAPLPCPATSPHNPGPLNASADARPASSPVLATAEGGSGGAGQGPSSPAGASSASTTTPLPMLGQLTSTELIHAAGSSTSKASSSKWSGGVPSLSQWPSLHSWSAGSGNNSGGDDDNVANGLLLTPALAEECSALVRALASVSEPCAPASVGASEGASTSAATVSVAETAMACTVEGGSAPASAPGAPDNRSVAHSIFAAPSGGGGKPALRVELPQEGQANSGIASAVFNTPVGPTPMGSWVAGAALSGDGLAAEATAQCADNREGGDESDDLFEDAKESLQSSPAMAIGSPELERQPAPAVAVERGQHAAPPTLPPEGPESHPVAGSRVELLGSSTEISPRTQPRSDSGILDSISNRLEYQPGCSQEAKEVPQHAGESVSISSSVCTSQAKAAENCKGKASEVVGETALPEA